MAQRETLDSSPAKPKARARETGGVKAGQLAKLLHPFHLICDAKSPVADYRAIQFVDGKLLTKTARAALELNLDLGLARPFAIDAAPLYNVVNSLLPDQDITFSQQDVTLSWRCGRARGTLATAPHKPLKPIPNMPSKTIECDAKLANLLDMGTLSCSNSALASVGLLGMAMVVSGKELHCMSSDDVTISVARGTNINPPSTKPITLGPMEADLLGEMIRNFQGEIGLTDDYIIYRATQYSDEYLAQISLIPPLKYDLAKVVIPYMRNSNRQYEIPRESIAAFIRRATYLAETRQRTRVTLTADTNSISLRFAENMAQTDEQFEIADLGVDTPMKINVDALKLGRALSRCNQLVLDHIDKRALVFKSKDGDFVYIVAGQAETPDL